MEADGFAGVVVVDAAVVVVVDTAGLFTVDEADFVVVVTFVDVVSALEIDDAFADEPAIDVLKGVVVWYAVEVVDENTVDAEGVDDVVDVA